MVEFRKQKISDERFEAASVADIDNDGQLEIISGEYIYKAPDWSKTRFREVKPEGEYFNDFGDLPLDVNGNGRLDIVTGAWWEKTLKWIENPGLHGEWKTHDIDECGSIETLRLFDIDGDGEMEVFPNTPGRPQAFYKLKKDSSNKPCGEFTKYVLQEEKSQHGMGFGDINGNGRTDIVLRQGWLEAPEDIFSGHWTFHREFDLGGASVPIIVMDVTGNGMNDLIVGQAHGYGLHWYEQGKDTNGSRTWTQHVIDETASQYHDIQVADIDNDGKPEIITGKRYRAHNGNDPGSEDPVFVCYFKINNGTFEQHFIDRGAPGECSGTGIHFAIADLNANGNLDIVAPGKDGLFLFENLGS